MSNDNMEARGGDVHSPPSHGFGRNQFIPEGHVVAGNFVIESVVGQGGMAVVYKAIQKSLNRPVALKALHSRFTTDADFVARFEAEAGALASLTHPNIVHIIERGHDGSCYFFIMEFVDGKTLDQMIIENTLTPAHWRRVVAACGEGLEYVHKRGVVHRDIKPSNILISDDGQVKISDFGIAHLLRGDGMPPPSGNQGRKPRAVGTAHYMAPEQTTNPGSVDHRADIYSLGVTYYKMLARALPTGDSFQLPSEMNADVPVSVDRVILKALSKDRDLRYQTVREFTEELTKALREHSTSIVSVLGSRRGQAGGSLYTGADFRSTPAPISPGKEKGTERGRKPEGSEKDSSSCGFVAQSASKILQRLTPIPVRKEQTPEEAPTDGHGVSKKKDAGAKHTPAPTPPPVPAPKRTPMPSAPDGTPLPSAESELSAARQRKIALFSFGLAVILIAAVIGAVLFLNKPAEEPAVPEVNPGRTVTQEKEELYNEILREREEAPGGDGTQTIPPVEETPEP